MKAGHRRFKDEVSDSFPYGVKKAEVAKVYGALMYLNLVHQPPHSRFDFVFI